MDWTKYNIYCENYFHCIFIHINYKNKFTTKNLTFLFECYQYIFKKYLTNISSVQAVYAIGSENPKLKYENNKYKKDKNYARI